MAFIYCDDRQGGCGWQQDDFWSWSYNPIRSILQYFRDYSRPRMIDFDPKPYSYGRVFSWYVLFDLIRRTIRSVQRQVWWTEAAFRKAMVGERWPNCPNCGRHTLGVD